MTYTTRLKTLFQRPALFVLAGGINPIGAKMAEALGTPSRCPEAIPRRTNKDANHRYHLLLRANAGGQLAQLAAPPSRVRKLRRGISLS
jgi:hypothetical protein